MPSMRRDDMDGSRVRMRRMEGIFGDQILIKSAVIRNIRIPRMASF
jgi:hypothetical protein